MDAPTVELKSALVSMFESGKYSDLTIVSANKSYPVHRALLASRSSFFDGACSNPFRESETGVIDLTQDDPEAVEYMIHYFYHLDYLEKPRSRRSSRRSSSSTSPRRSRFPACRRPKKVDLSLVEDPLLAMIPAEKQIENQLTPRVEQPADQGALDAPMRLDDSPMADHLIDDHLDYVVESKADAGEPHLMRHVKVYAIGEKYGIAGLKSLARQKFTDQIEVHLDSEELPEAFQEAYESTVDTDRGLRDIIIQAFRSHPELSCRKDIELVIRETPGLAFELFRMASGLPVTSCI